MNWYKQINKILGFFWLNVWRDSWLTELLGRFLHLIIGRNLFDKVQNIQKQAACTSLQTTDNIRYIPVYIESNSAVAYAWVSKNDTQFNQRNLTIDKLLYTKCPNWLQLSVSDTSYKLLPWYDFDWESGTIKIRRSVTQKITQNTIWAVYESYTAVLDRFTEIMGLPAQWVYKYPGAVQAAWSIKQNGANQRDVVKLLAAIGGSGQWCGGQQSQEQSSESGTEGTFQDDPCLLKVIPLGTAGMVCVTQECYSQAGQEFCDCIEWDYKDELAATDKHGWLVYVTTEYQDCYHYLSCDQDDDNTYKYYVQPKDDGMFMNNPYLFISILSDSCCIQIQDYLGTRNINLTQTTVAGEVSELNPSGTLVTYVPVVIHIERR